MIDYKPDANKTEVETFYDTYTKSQKKIDFSIDINLKWIYNKHRN